MSIKIITKLSKDQSFMKQRVLRIIAGIMIALLVIRFSSAPFVILKSLLSTIAAPFLLIQSTLTATIERWRTERLSYREMQHLIEHLRVQNKNLLQENIALHNQLWFVRSIDELVTFKKRYYLDNAILGQVVLKTFSNNEHSFIIDKGSWHGIKEDMIAVWHNCLIGRVTSVLPLQSKVTLLTDSSCKIAACCLDSKAQGIVQGTHNRDSLTLQYVDHLAPLRCGEKVVSSGQGTIFPKGFFLGTIIYCQSEELYYSIVVKTACDISKIDYCWLMLKGMYDAEDHEKIAV